jgi:hypothetical protein
MNMIRCPECKLLVEPAKNKNEFYCGGCDHLYKLEAGELKIIYWKDIVNRELLK